MALTSRLVVLVMLLASAGARAEIIDWWLTPDQRGRLLFERSEYALAAQRFADPLWKGLSFYAAQDFVSAASYFAQVNTAYGYFYLGNAYAHQGMLRDAVAAYKAALKLHTDFEEARFNLEWVQGLYDLQQREYDDATGTGGKLAADDFVVDDRAAKSEQMMSAEDGTGRGLSDENIEELWMRRVQTTPADFLTFKFAYQTRRQSTEQ